MSGVSGSVNINAPAAPAAPAPGSAGATGGNAPNPGNAPANPGAQTGNTQDFRSLIPEAYREKPYLKDVKSAEDAFKMLDNAQSLIGRQGKGIPAADAPQDQWDQFFNAAGRPEAPDKYEFKRADGAQVNAEADKQVKAILHKHGLTAKQATGLVADYEAFQSAADKAYTQAREKEFDDTILEVFGGDKAKQDAALKTSQEMLAHLAPKEVVNWLPELGARAALVLAAVMNNVKAKYTGEDVTRLGNPQGAANGAQTEAEIRAEGSKLMQSDAFKDQFHKDHDRVKKQVAEIYGRIK